MFRRTFLYIILILCLAASVSAQTRYSLSEDKKSLFIHSNFASYEFKPEFSVLYTSQNPDMALRPAGISGVSYNVPTWKTHPGKRSDLKQTTTDASVAGDGFDDRILHSNQSGRTTSIINGAEEFKLKPITVKQIKDTVFFIYPKNEYFSLSAKLILNHTKHPSISYTLTPFTDGYFSVGYTGAPSFEPATLSRIWQPLIWQEMRFPDRPYLTTAHMSPLPTTMLNDGKNTLGVMASPKYLPFDPLPLITNSQFGIALRNDLGKAQNTVYAPMLGGYNSLMKAGSTFDFTVYLIVEPLEITQTYEKLARTYFGFKDYRRNDISTLNQTIDNISKYSLSKFAWFIDSLKGFAYSTDVPGAVKNVSSLNPLELSLVTDNPEMFEKRAYPLMEYMLSREKFLFALDSTQKIQSPSRKLKGPVAPISELVSLYNIFNKVNPLFKDLATEEYSKVRERNLDVQESGDNWMNSMHLYNASGDPEHLRKAIAGADAYLKSRVQNPQTTFHDKYAGGLFFWPTFTNRWIDLLNLYEITQDKKYLDAAREGARNYTMFTWMAPAIPDTMITVNKGGKAPIYWYLKSKGHKQMYYPEEKAPAWRLSEIGLTPESSGTSAGHRAIFMTNYAPWMLKLGYYANDPYLKEVAKSAIIGRYRNFPGYHINTERTTAYEKADFPLNAHLDQSVNSFHYNHILPMASLLLDYLVTDAFVRSNGQINFPSEFIEGYAYMQSNFYGNAPGQFYNEKDVTLWMPAGLAKTSHVELNYISGRRGNSIFLAFMNQSRQAVHSRISLSAELLGDLSGASYSTLKDGQWNIAQNLNSAGFDVSVAANGLVVLRVDHVNPLVRFQDKLLSNNPEPVINDHAEISFGKAKAYSFRLGEISKAYVYLEEDDNVFSEVSMSYKIKGQSKQKLKDQEYPFEFTVDLPKGKNAIQLTLSGIRKDGSKVKSEKVRLGY